MAATVTIFGTAISVSERTYGSFKGADGQQVPGGVTSSLWVLEDSASAPVEIRVGGDKIVEARSLIGKELPFLCQAFAQKNSISYRFDRAGK